MGIIRVLLGLYLGCVARMLRDSSMNSCFHEYSYPRDPSI